MHEKCIFPSNNRHARQKTTDAQHENNYCRTILPALLAPPISRSSGTSGGQGSVVVEGKKRGTYVILLYEHLPLVFGLWFSLREGGDRDVRQYMLEELGVDINIWRHGLGIR
jgi:hypothetical protein